jgi:ribosomal protein RSM22 (predicted rRNA methylase)
MSSFNSFEKYRYFNLDNFFSFWQGYVFGIEDYNKLEEGKKRSETDKMRDRIKNLWLSFNEDRDEFRKKYSGTKKFIRAYISSFYLSNIQRVYSLLTQKSNLKELISTFENSGDTFTVLDFGAGPMSASLGLLFVLDQSGMNLNSKKIRILTVERSPQMIDSGIELLKSGFAAEPEIEFQNYSSALKVNEKCDFIICANVFNEIPLKHRFSNLETLLSLSKGCLLITEPGQDVHSKALSSLRNEMIEKCKIPLNVISPCLHSKKCPLCTESDRTDWCWFNTPWRVPEQVALVDRITGLDHRQLNYSYLFLKTEKTSHPDKSYRIVSDIINPVKKDNRNRFENWMRNNIIEGNSNCLSKVRDVNVCKILLCGSDGILCSAVGDLECFSGLKRGNIITSIHQNACMCRERQL